MECKTWRTGGHWISWIFLLFLCCVLIWSASIPWRPEDGSVLGVWVFLILDIGYIFSRCCFRVPKKHFFVYHTIFGGFEWVQGKDRLVYLWPFQKIYVPISPMIQIDRDTYIRSDLVPYVFRHYEADEEGRLVKPIWQRAEGKITNPVDLVSCTGELLNLVHDGVVYNAKSFYAECGLQALDVTVLRSVDPGMDTMCPVCLDCGKGVTTAVEMCCQAIKQARYAGGGDATCAAVVAQVLPEVIKRSKAPPERKDKHSKEKSEKDEAK